MKSNVENLGLNIMVIQRDQIRALAVDFVVNSQGSFNESSHLRINFDQLVVNYSTLEVVGWNWSKIKDSLKWDNVSR